ncbi:MAG: amino acid adenylation domain-containing protein [Verrucomicrobiota bacterium]
MKSAKRSHHLSRLAFLFPGQGAQHPGMARDLFEHEPIFRETIDECAAILEPEIGLSLIDLITPPAEREEEMAATLRDTSLAQPSIFAVSYALAKLWQHWGIEPEILVGHSIGEFAAATYAGVFTLPEALRLIAKRGRLMSDLPGGVMISVRATEEEMAPFLGGDFDLAAVNGAKALVLAGPYEGAEDLERRLEEAGFVAKRLHTSHAFHSHMMDPIVSEFEDAVRSVTLSPPKHKIFSTVHVDWLSAEEATNPRYWAAHLRKPVRFYDAIATLWDDPSLGFLEVGPGNTLATLASQNPEKKAATVSFSSLPHPAREESSHQHILHTAANLWSHGWNTDWATMERRGKAKRRRVSLPTYPFQRERYWVEPPADEQSKPDSAPPAEATTPPAAEETETTQERDSKSELQEIFAELSGLDAADLDVKATFLELGLDSLLLTQASRELQEAFGLKITLRELIDQFSTIEALAEHLQANAASKPEKVAPIHHLEAPATKAPEPVSAPALKLTTKTQSELEPKQRRHIDDLIARYTKRTAQSKALTAKHRKAHADPRTASGFNREWKEMVYQIVTERSKGSRLLDVDGNEYIDILNGFGPGFLGHSPDFLTEAIEDQLHRGFEVGPNQRVAMEAAELFCEVTGNERTSFVCTGSEAVQASMRLARTVTGRDKVVIFARDYHGNFDEVLVRGVNGKNGLKSLPVAPGIPKRAAEDMIVLPYGTDESLAFIRQIADDLAAVIVEPVQSRRPEFRPRDFIREVREITRRSGTLFVFDEVVTGFRFGPGGAQDYYGVDADLATYGKVVGGGMPVGVVSGKAEYMDTFDGGDWNYGDDSFPEKPVTFFAGTFVRHPLAMASLKAMLSFFREQPLHFWQSLNAKGDRLAGTVHRFFQDHHLPYELPNRGSLLFARVGEDQPYGNLLFYHLRERGVFLLEGFPSYLTASHTDEDIDHVISAFEDSAAEMQEAGFFPESEPISKAPDLSRPTPAPSLSLGKEPEINLSLAPFEISTTQPQREIVVASSLNAQASCAFNESASLSFEGHLDKTALEESVQKLTERHDALRATFSKDGTTMIVHPHLGIDFTHSDNLPETLAAEARTPFDLTKGPLMRMRLVEEDEDHHTLVMTAHHAIVDGWSYNVIAEELASLYNASVDESSKVRHAEPKQFAEHAREQTHFATTESWREQQVFWMGQFETIPPAIELPLDRPHPIDRTFAGGTVTHSIDQTTYEAIKLAGAKEGATLYGTLSAVFALFLHRLSGQEELVYCIPAAGQNDGENTDNLIGHCVNFLPLRSSLDANERFSEFLQRNRDTFLEATDHRSYTYGELIRDLKISREANRMPLSEVAFNLERMDYFGEWSGLEVDFQPNPKSNVHYTLFLNIVESKNGLRLDFDYNGDVLEEATVARWARQFEALVATISTRPSDSVAALSLLPETDRTTILEEWSGANRLPEDLPSVPEIFRDTVATHRNDTALVNTGATLTYGELDEASSRIAAALQNAGVRKGDSIGLLLDRSFDLISSLLGILKAGAAYVPIDPAYPASRITLMLEDSEAKFLIADSFEGSLPCSVLTPETLLQCDPDRFTPASLTGEDAAYIIYTSGSTGRPKGTVIPHRGIVRLVRETDYISFSQEETFLLSSPITFDASTLELWGSLLNGGRLALLPPGTPTLPELGDAIKTFEVSTLWLTAGLFQLMVDERLDDLAGLRQLLVGGDVVSRSHASKALAALAPKGHLFNGYGPTENTTFTTVHPISLEDTKRPSLPIGKPIPGTTVYLLDEEMSPVPAGVKGRLYFGGTGLALGYLNEPEMTAQAFLPHPFREGELVYDSGDHGRWRSDGSIEFLGRADEQVKIRGFRIETGEIETVLEAHRDVRGAAIVVTGDSAESKQLSAFLLPEAAERQDLDSVLHHAKERLPAYMIPNRVTFRKEFPITANGKVDYRKLREEAEQISEIHPSSDPASSSEKSPPETDTEKVVASLWSEILRVETIHRNDDFFTLGGHSLAGLRLFTRLQDRYGIDLPLATLFQASTVESLSARIDARLEKQPVETKELNLLTEIRNGDPDETPLFLVHGGDGGTLFYKDFADQLSFPGPVYTIEAPILIDPDYRAIETDMEKTAERYLHQIRQKFPEQSIHLGGYSFGGTVAYAMACQLQETATPVDSLILFDTPNPAREHEFKNGFSGRLVSDWKSQSDEALLKQITRFGVHLIEGFQNKVEYLNHIRTLKKDHGDTLDLPEHLKILKIQEEHRKLIEGFAPSAYEGRVYLFRALIQSGAFEFNRSMGWNNLISDLEVHDVTGNHETIFNEPHVRTLSSRCSEIFAHDPKPYLLG